jgi:hypothetical protein
MPVLSPMVVVVLRKPLACCCCCCPATRRAPPASCAHWPPKKAECPRCAAGAAACRGSTPREAVPLLLIERAHAAATLVNWPAPLLLQTVICILKAAEREYGYRANWLRAEGATHACNGPKLMLDKQWKMQRGRQWGQCASPERRRRDSWGWKGHAALTSAAGGTSHGLAVLGFA